MKRAMILMISVVPVSALLADGELYRYKGLRHLSYDLRTGEITWLDDGQNQTRTRRQIWSASVDTGFFWGSATELAHDWGDLRDAAATPVTQFEFGYATNSATADGIECDVSFYTNDDGHDSVGRVLVAGYRLRGLPGVDPEDNLPNNTGRGFTIRVSIDDTPISLDGPDLDDPNATPRDPFGACLDIFGASDFAYTQRYRRTGGGVVGPLLDAPAADPNLPPCPGFGSENNFDWYSLDPNDPPADPNAILQPDSDYRYVGAFWFGGFPYAQFHLILWTGEPNGVCPQEGCSTDLDGDCAVTLADLSAVLGSFGQSGAILRADFDGDGDVDLADLALILSEFGNDCN